MVLIFLTLLFVLLEYQMFHRPLWCLITEYQIYSNEIYHIIIDMIWSCRYQINSSKNMLIVLKIVFTVVMALFWLEYT